MAGDNGILSSRILVVGFCDMGTLSVFLVEYVSK